jgi:hypothetical protein
MARCSLCTVIVLLLCGLLLTGCGNSTGSGTVRTTGVVTFDGQPVAGANVIFYPVAASDPALASQAVTDPEGKFQLGTYAGGGKFKPGIAPGQYTVAITKLDTAAIKSTLAPPKHLLPRKYENPKTSKLTADVSSERENNFEFSLSPE